MNRTAIVILTWNRITMLKNTITTFKKYHDLKDKHFIVVDNGSTDGTRKFLKSTKFDLILNKSNLGAQMGKYIGWNRAVERGYDFILFIEDDSPCYKTVPIVDLENYLDGHGKVGIIRLNDKCCLRKHQITKLPIISYGEDELNSAFKISKSNYHFTSSPSIFRTSLVDILKGCVLPEYKPTKIDVEKLGFDKKHMNYELAKKRSLMDFGVMEKEYMRLYLLYYKVAAHLIPPCFNYINTSYRRVPEWIN